MVINITENVIVILTEKQTLPDSWGSCLTEMTRGACKQTELLHYTGWYLGDGLEKAFTPVLRLEITQKAGFWEHCSDSQVAAGLVTTASSRTGELLFSTTVRDARVSGERWCPCACGLMHIPQGAAMFKWSVLAKLCISLYACSLHSGEQRYGVFH